MRHAAIYSTPEQRGLLTRTGGGQRLAALGVAPGDTLHTQFVLLDPGAAPGARVRTSSAISITFAP